MTSLATLDRRTLLKALALAPTLAVSIPRTVRAQAQAAGLISSDVCMVMPELTEGPFYLDPKLIRADITEGRPGLPLALRLQVVTADCTPVAGARVDVWHCDALGVYSGVENLGGGADTVGQTFLRGTQVTDAAGVATFQTIYPGWYKGRTTHIHYKVFLDQTTALTSQLFFAESVNDTVYRGQPPYDGRTEARDTLNGNDGIAKQAGDGAYCTVTPVPGHYAAAMVVGINPAAGSGLFDWLRRKI